MNFELKIAWRYFRAKRKSLARFTALAAIIGIAAGVASLILAQSLARGFSDEMQNKILAHTAHISVFQTNGAEIENWQTIKEKIEKYENVIAISPTTYESAVISGSKGNGYAVLRAVQNSALKISNSGEIEISLGKELAEKTGLKINETADLIVIGDQILPQTFKVVVKETFQTGLYEYDATWIYVSPEIFARIKGQNIFTPTILSVSVKDIYQTPQIAAELRRNLGDALKVVDWQEANQPLFAALGLERKVAFSIICLIIFIAALNITTTLTLLVNERRLDIAILRTCGAKTNQLIFIFLFEGLFLGVFGIFGGVGLGLLGCWVGNRFQIVSLAKEIYSLSYVPFHPDLANILLIIIVAFLICLTATVYPAYQASRIKPLENLRQQ